MISVKVVVRIKCDDFNKITSFFQMFRTATLIVPIST